MSSSGLVEVSSVHPTVEFRTTERRCVTCLTTRSLDDEGPTLGTVRWKISSGDSGVKIGIAVNFQCLNGHTSDDDPQHLKAFPSRRF
jgi:hypothetical protein